MIELFYPQIILAHTLIMTQTEKIRIRNFFLECSDINQLEKLEAAKAA